MKRSTKNPAMKLVEKFDQQLHEMLMSDLRAIRNARINLIKHINFNRNDGRMIA